MSEPVCVEDFEKIAKQRMDPTFWQFYATASGTGATLRRNRWAFQRLSIVPQVLRKSVAHRDLSVKILASGPKLDMPIGISPTAFHKYAHPDGEIASAKAAEKMGSVFIHSGWSSTTMEELAAAVPGVVKWQNIYIFKNRSKVFELVSRAEKAGFQAVVISVDIPELSKCPSRTNRELDIIKTKAESMNIRAAHFTNPNDLVECRAGDPAATWKDFEDICKFTNLPVIAKGITTARDCKAALAHGAAAVMVSTHGGRQLDCMRGSLESLPEVVEAANGRCDVFFDSGIRTGDDVFKALALGAKAVFIGRPVLWGLAYKGQAGVEKILDILREELDLTMALSGCTSTGDISQEFVVFGSSFAKL